MFRTKFDTLKWLKIHTYVVLLSLTILFVFSHRLFNRYAILIIANDNLFEKFQIYSKRGLHKIIYKICRSSFCLVFLSGPFLFIIDCINCLINVNTLNYKFFFKLMQVSEKLCHSFFKFPLKSGINLNVQRLFAPANPTPRAIYVSRVNTDFISIYTAQMSAYTLVVFLLLPLMHLWTVWDTHSLLVAL